MRKRVGKPSNDLISTSLKYVMIPLRSKVKNSIRLIDTIYFQGMHKQMVLCKNKNSS